MSAPVAAPAAAAPVPPPQPGTPEFEAAIVATLSAPAKWSEGPFSNGTGPNTLPVLDTASLTADTPFPALKNDLFLRTARGEACERTPVWCHRQAGRYLPEFKETRRLGDLFTMCRTPRIAVELTLQPIRRFALDAAIIFSDILVIPQALGMEVLMKEGVGPVLPAPIRTPDQMSRLKKREEVDVKSSLKYVFDAIRLCRHSLQGTVPLIGFCGAPWTLACYMIEGGGSKSYTQARRWLFAHPAESHALLSLITDVLIEYLVEQVRAGAQALEVFDTWSGELTQQCYDEFILPYVRKLAAEVKAQTKAQQLPSVPMTLFPKGSDSAATLRAIAQTTEYDLVSLDWATNPPEARAAVASAPRSVGLQGNLDPAVLYCSEEQIRAHTRKMLDAFGTGGRLVANLGHGMLPDHPLEGLRVFVDEVHNYSPNLCKQPAQQQ